MCKKDKDVQEVKANVCMQEQRCACKKNMLKCSYL